VQKLLGPGELTRSALRVTMVLRGSDRRFEGTVNSDGGGEFEIPHLPPGVYDIFVDNSCLPNSADPYRAVRIYGLKIEAGKVKTGNIVVKPGNGIDEYGKPGGARNQTPILSDAIAELDKQIDDAKK